MDDAELRRLAAEAFRQMDQQAGHPSLDQMTEYAQGAVSGVRREEVEKHLAGCEACRLRLEEFEHFLADCELPASQDLSPEWNQLRSRIIRHKTASAARRWSAVAAVLIVAAGLSWLVIWIVKPSPERLLAQAYKE